MKFFGKEEIDPKTVVHRFQTLTNSLTSEDADKIIASLSERDRKAFAEMLDSGYDSSFNALYADYKHIDDKGHDLKRFLANQEFFAGIKEKNEELKIIATKNKIYESNESLKKLLLGQTNVNGVDTASINFKEINSFNAKNTTRLEMILKAIADYPFEENEGANSDQQRQAALKLVSDLLRINGEVVSTVRSEERRVGKECPV